jgi:hypothetical protein
MTVYTITIDLDAPCIRCGKPGAVNGGICLKCALRRAEQLHKAESLARLGQHAAEVGVTAPEINTARQERLL